MPDVQTDDLALRPLTAFNNSAAGIPLSPMAPPESGDPALRPLSAFNPDRGVTTFTPKPTWHAEDIPKGVSASLASGVAAPLAEVTGQTETAKQARAGAAATRETMTPGAEETWPVWLAEQVPPTAAMMGPGLVAGTVGAPAAVVAGVGIGAGALMQGAGEASSNKGVIEDTPDETLLNNPTYYEYRKTMSEAEAKAKLGSDEALRIGIPSAILGGVMGGTAGIEMTALGKLGIDKDVLTALTGGGRFKGAVQGAGRGLIEQGVPGGAQEAVTKHVEAQEGVGKEATGQEIMAAGIGQGLFGATLTGVSGAAHGTQTGGEITVKRTKTDGYQKPEAEFQTPPGTIQTENAGPAPPASPVVDPAHQAAMDAAQGKTPTPGVGEAQAKPVEQSDVVQPPPPPSGEAATAPPAGDTTAPPSPPPPAAEASPAPAPPAPAPTVGPPVPETEAILRDQQAAMMDPANAREAVVYPPGMKPFDITANKWRYGTVKLPDGRWVQYDTRGPRALTKAKIADLAKKDADGNDKINELLQLGPVTQTEAVKQSVAGGDPAVVTERAPPTVPGEPGLERKAVEGTTATAPAQMEALEATKTPGSTVQVETHEQAMASRLKPEPAPVEAATPRVEPVKIGETKYLSVWDNGDGTYFKRYADGRPDEPIKETVAKLLTAQEAYKPQVSEAEKIREAAQASAPPPVRRVLRSETEEEKLAAARQAETDAAQAAKVAAEAGAPPKIKPVKPPEEVKGAKKGKPADDKVRQINAIADEVVKNHPMLSEQEKLAAIDPTREGGKGARLKALAYVKELLDKAQAAGFEFKDRFMHRKDEELQHSNAASVLYEAKLLRDSKEKDFGRFFHHEHELRSKGREAYHDLLKQRFESGKEWANKANKPTGEAKAVEDVEKAAQPTAREGVSIGGVEKPDVHAELEAAKERVADEAVAKAPGEARKETPLQKQAREVSERARAKLAEQEAREKAAKERPTQESREEAAPAAPRAAMGFKVEARGRAKLDELRAKINEKKPELKDEEDALPPESKPADEHKTGTDKAPAEGHLRFRTGPEKGDYVDLKTSRPSTTIGAAIHEHLKLEKYAPWMAKMMEKLRDAVIEIAGNTPVHYISHAELMKAGKSLRGLYRYGEREPYIILNSDKMSHDTALHEGFHGATLMGIEGNPALAASLRNMRNILNHYLINNHHLTATLSTDDLGRLNSALKDGRGIEMMTYLMTNEGMQNLFKAAKLTTEQAKSFGIAAWLKKTMWEGALSLMRRGINAAMGKEVLGPRDTPAIAAMMQATEEAMLAHPRGEKLRFEAAERMGKSLLKDFEDAHEEVDTAAKGAQEAAHPPHEFWKGEFAKARASGTMQTVYNAWSKAAASDTLRVISEHLFGRRDENNPMRRWQEGLAKQEQLIRKVLGDRSPLIQRVADMKRSDPNGLHEVVNLLLESRDFNVHPDDPLGAGRNDYIKSRKFDETAGTDRHEAILAHPRLSDTFGKMSPAKQALFRDLRDQLQDEGRKSAEATFQTFVGGLKENFAKDKKLQAALAKSENDRSPAELKQVERYNAISKVMDGDKLEGDEREKFAADPHIQSLQGYRAMLSHEGPFYPTPRKGDFVVNAIHELPKAPNALSVKDNEVTFATRKEAYEYRRTLVENSLPSRMEAVHEPVSSEQMHGQGKETYKVTVQNKHSSAAEDVHEGNKLSAVLKAQGLKDVSPPMLREKNPDIDYGLHSGSIRAINHAIDALTHLSSEQKEGMKEALEQGTLGLMRGSKADLGLMNRNRVRGANADPVLAIHDYFSASARNRARAKTMPDIDRALGEMREVARTTGDADTWKRGMLIREMENRTLNYGKDGFTGQMPQHLQHISTLAYLKYMMAPIHYALDMMHPYLITIPQLAGRFGFAKSHVEFERAMGDIGGRTPALVKGLTGAWKAAWETGKPPTDFIEGMMDALKKNGGTAQEISAIQRAMETGALHSILMDFRPHMDRTGKFDTAMQRAQNVGQEMSSAVDAINRMASFLAAYRLERGKMGKAETMAESAAHHAQATRFAKDHTTQTLGLYSASNRSSMLKNPYVRTAMQFRSVPMMIYKILGRNVYNAFKGESKEVRWAAVRSLVATMGSTAVLVGAPGGVPEPIRLAVMLTHMFGLTGSWEQIEDEARRASDEALGPVGGRLVMDGVLGAAGLSAGNRIGLNDLLASQQSMRSPKDFLFETMVGASGGYLNDEASAFGKILGGDLKKGIPAAIPIRLFSDVAKAWVEGEEGRPQTGRAPGMTPLDPFEMFIKAMGGQPTREALHGKMQGLIKEESAERAATQKSGDLSEIRSWNLSHPHNRISITQALKAKQANKPESATTRQLREDYHAYQ